MDVVLHVSVNIFAHVIHKLADGRRFKDSIHPFSNRFSHLHSPPERLASCPHCIARPLKESWVAHVLVFPCASLLWVHGFAAGSRVATKRVVK